MCVRVRERDLKVAVVLDGGLKVVVVVKVLVVLLRAGLPQRTHVTYGAGGGLKAVPVVLKAGVTLLSVVLVEVVLVLVLMLVVVLGVGLLGLKAI